MRYAKEVAIPVNVCKICNKVDFKSYFYSNNSCTKYWLIVTFCSNAHQIFQNCLVMPHPFFIGLAILCMIKTYIIRISCSYGMRCITDEPDRRGESILTEQN